MQKIVLQIIYSTVVRWFLKLIVGVRFDDARFLLAEKQFIIIANHNSHLDTMTLLASLPRSIVHRVKPVAATDHFGKTKLKKKFTEFFVNALLIPRKRNFEQPEKDPVNMMLKALDEGYSLILFPEGTRGKPGEEQKFKKGIGLVLQERPEVKLVPAYMRGMGKILPKDSRIIVPVNSFLKYGKPVKIQGKTLEEIMEEVTGEYQKLKNSIHHE